MKKILSVVGLLCLFSINGPIAAADAVRIGLMLPMSGPFANIGELYRTSVQFAVDEVNARGGVLGGRPLQVVLFDNRNSAQEAIVQLRQVIDQKLPVLIQTGGSHVAVPLSEAIARHNEREPGNRLILLNPSGDQELSTTRCSFWTFLFMVNTEVKLEAFTRYIAARPEIRRVYLINQDMAFGHQMRQFSREMLARKRPDLEIVGDDLHPIGKVKDFAPYVAKIKAAKADAVITGNWGQDMTLLVKAATEAGLSTAFYTFYGLSPGSATVMGQAAIERVRILWRWDWDMRVPSMRRAAQAYKKRFDLEYYATPVGNMIEMLAVAMQQAGGTDAVKLARALEGMRYRGDLGEVWMRAEDHQLFERLHVLTVAALNGKEVNHDIEGAGIGVRSDAVFEAADLVLPGRCRLQGMPLPGN